MVAVLDVQALVQVLAQHLVRLTVQEIAMDHVKDVHYHVQQVVAGITLVLVDQLVLAVAVLIVEQDVKDVVVHRHQIDIVVIYLMNM